MTGSVPKPLYFCRGPEALIFSLLGLARCDFQRIYIQILGCEVDLAIPCLNENWPFGPGKQLTQLGKTSSISGGSLIILVENKNATSKKQTSESDGALIKPTTC